MALQLLDVSIVKRTPRTPSSIGYTPILEGLLGQDKKALEELILLVLLRVVSVVMGRDQLFQNIPCLFVFVLAHLDGLSIIHGRQNTPKH